MSFIGGNLDDIETSAARMVDSGATAVAAGSDTHNATVVLASAIDEAMTTLLARFEAIAETLRGDIARSHAVLGSSDWHGQSRENALALKEALQGQVNTVLGTAATNLNAEKTMFISRSQGLVESVQSEFQRVMAEVDAEYTTLAAASRRTRDNLALADQTIAI